MLINLKVLSCKLTNTELNNKCVSQSNLFLPSDRWFSVWNGHQLQKTLHFNIYFSFYNSLTNHVKHEVPYQKAQCHSTAKYESSS